MLGERIRQNDLALPQVISGAVDADKIDYMIRDSQACGISLGIDISRVFLRAGVYRVAAAVSALVTLPLMAVHMPLAPAVARAHVKQKRGELQRMLTTTVRWAFVGCLPIVIAIVWVGDWLLGVVYGQDFATAYPVLAVLALAQLFNVAIGSAGIVLQMTGHQRHVE